MDKEWLSYETWLFDQAFKETLRRHPHIDLDTDRGRGILAEVMEELKNKK